MNLTGQRFGRLVAIEVAEQYHRDANGKKHPTLWRFRCDCGNEHVCLLNSVKRGATRSCGCLSSERKSARRHDLTGKRFGRLVAVEAVRNSDGRIRWRFRCDCGNEHITRACDVKGGLTQSCGCLGAELTSKRFFEDLTGQRFGRLVALELVEKRPGDTRWRFQCDCGNEHITRGAQVKSGKIQSCGCFAAERTSELSSTRFLKHGHTARRKPSSEYRTWVGMKQRCFNENSPFYEEYGGRGISVCDEWVNSFEAYLAYLDATIGRKPSPQHSIDRIDNDGDYCPGNIRWATKKEQANNRRPRRKLAA